MKQFTPQPSNDPSVLERNGSAHSVDMAHGTRLKICHIIATVEGGNWCFEQLCELRDRYGHEVTVILPGTEGGLPQKFRDAGIRIIPFDFYSSGRKGDVLVKLIPRRVRELAALLRLERFDVVQTHLYMSMLMGRCAAWLADVPVRLAMIPGPYYLQAYTTWWVDRWTCWMETGIIPSCQLTYDLYRKMGVPARKLRTIYYGPDPKGFDPAATKPAGLRAEFGWDPSTPIIVMVAYFYPRLGFGTWIPTNLQGKGVKGHDDLVRAAPLILKEFPNAKIVLVGGGWGPGGPEFMDDIRSLVAELGLNGQVVFLGHRSDVPNIYMDADVAVQASLNENLGGSIEALLMERPTVVTRVGGLVDAVLDGETGVQVLPENPQSLAEGILRLLRDKSFATRLGRAGRAYMLSKFTLKTAAHDLAQFYAEQLGHKRGAYRKIVGNVRYWVGAFIFLAMGVRYVLVDHYTKEKLASGWRPWDRFFRKRKN